MGNAGEAEPIGAEGVVPQSIYESAVKGRQDFRQAYRDLLPVQRAAAALCLLWRTPGERPDSDQFADALNALDVAICGGHRNSISKPFLEQIATRTSDPKAVGVEREAIARNLLMALDALLGKPIDTGPIAEKAYQLILTALRAVDAAPGGGVSAADEVGMCLSDAADFIAEAQAQIELGPNAAVATNRLEMAIAHIQRLAMLAAAPATPTAAPAPNVKHTEYLRGLVDGCDAAEKAVFRAFGLEPDGTPLASFAIEMARRAAPAPNVQALDGNEIWEALFGIMKGNVPDELTEAVCDQLADALAAIQAPAGEGMKDYE